MGEKGANFANEIIATILFVDNIQQVKEALIRY
jgi:hypothetical protein